jgi:serine/threonine protein kinase
MVIYANLITWDQRLNKIYDICLALNNIHVHGLIHKDLHSGNIFIDSTFAYIGDFGFCMPANEILSNSTKKNIYGVIPPFNNQPHDHYLTLDICRDLCPNIREELQIL